MPYDATSEPNEFVAESREEAVAKAIRFFGVDEEGLDLREPKNVYGLGNRVIVVAVPKSLKRGRPPAGGGGGGGSDRGGDRGGDRERGRRGRGGRSNRSERVEAARPEPEEELPAGEPAAVLQPVASKGTATGDLTPIGEYVLGVVERMGLGDFRISESAEEEFVVLQLEGPAVQRLNENDRAVGALQLLANQAAMRADEDPKRVVLDCEGESEQRESFIERLAGRAAQRAKETARAVALDPMNARDRRALHVAVRGIDGVVTMSVGTGRYRQVVIVPEGAPEYEEAATAAREAERRDSERDSR